MKVCSWWYFSFCG